MTVSTLTLPQAHVLLVLSLESQSVEEVAARLARRGHILEFSEVRFLSNSLVSLGLAVMSRGQKRGKLHYHLASGIAVEKALEQAYALVTRD